jgi:hypothetical protein
MSAPDLASRERPAYRAARRIRGLGARSAAGPVMLALAAAVVTLAAGLAAHSHSGPTAGVQRIPMVARLAVSRALGAADRSYWVRGASSGHLAAANGAQGFGERFVRSGVVVRTRSAWVGLAARELGRGRYSLRLTPSVPSASRNRVSYRRKELVEWYANGPSGVEQGFTVATAPRGTGPLSLGLALSGTLRARLVDGGRAVSLIEPSGRAVLRYAGLSAVDASGRSLPARLGVSGRRLTLSIDDRGARYPLRIDPYVQAAKLTAGTSLEQLGWSLAMSGNTIAAGAPLYPGDGSKAGAVYVFVEPAGGWADTTTPTAQLTDSTTRVLDHLGQTVAISGDAIVAGAHGNGYADVWVKPASGWLSTSTPTATLTDSAISGNTGFGTAVAISGDTIVVGDPAGGFAYVYVKPLGGWISATLPDATLEDNPGTVYFGSSVAISGDTVVVGDPGNNANTGAVFVFVKPDAGWGSTKQTISQTATLTPSGAPSGASLGTSVAVDGGMIVAGAPYWVDAASVQVGAAYVYEEHGGGWSDGTQTAILTASDGATGDEFGWSVGVSGATIAVGDPQRYVLNGQGAVYEFREPSSGWADAHEGQKLTASDTETNNLDLGYAVAIDASTIAGSADTSQNGRVYAFAAQTPTITTASLPAGTVGTAYGATVQGAGGSPPYTWSASGLPAGLSIDPASGAITGTPTADAAGSYSVTVTVTDSDHDSAARQYTLTISPAQAAMDTLTVALAGTGSGGVTGDQTPAVVCPGNCSEHYPNGTTVILTEKPAGNSVFAGWAGGGCIATSSTCKVTLAAGTTVTATFNSASNSIGPPLKVGGIPLGGYVRPQQYPLRINPQLLKTLHDPLVQGIEVTQGSQASFGSPAYSNGNCAGPLGILALLGPMFCYPQFPGDGLPYPSTPLGSQGLAASYYGVPLANGANTYVRVFVLDRLNTTASEPAPPVTLSVQIDGGGSGGNQSYTPAPSVQPQLIYSPQYLPPYSQAGGTVGNEPYVNGERSSTTLPYVFLLPAALWAEFSGVHGTSLTLVAHVNWPETATDGECLDAACKDNNTFTLSGIGPVLSTARLIIGTAAMGSVSFSKTFPPTPSYPKLEPAEQVFADVRAMYPGGAGFIIRPPMFFVDTTAIDKLQVDAKNNVLDANGKPSTLCGANPQPANFSLGTCQAQLYNNLMSAQRAYYGGYAQGVVAGDRTTASYDVLFGIQNGFVNRSWSGGGSIAALPGADVSQYPYGQVNQLRPVGGVAHEFGHMLGLIHAGTECGGGQDPAPDAAAPAGSADATDDQGQVGQLWPPDNLGEMQSYGFQVTSGRSPFQISPIYSFQVFDPNNDYDVMSYCGSDATRWLSAENWTASLNALNAYEERLSAAHLVARVTAPATLPAGTSAGSLAGSSLLVFGIVDGSRAAITNIEPAAAVPSLSSNTAGLALRAVSASGAATETPLALEPIHLDGTPADSEAFEAIAPASADRLEVVSGQTIIGSDARPPHAPSAKLVTPSDGTKIGARGALVSWTASDADGNPMYADVDVSTDDGRTWKIAALHVSGSSARLPAQLMPTSSRGRIRVRVSDGFNQTAVISGRLRFLGTPPQITITSVVPASSPTSAESVQLTAQAIDETGTILGGHALKWYDGHRPIGTGATVVLETPTPGIHRIRLIARGQSGQTATDTVVAHVIAAAPAITVLQAPASVAQSARSLVATVAANEPATVAVGKRRFQIGTVPRRVTIPLAGESGKVAQANLSLSAYGRRGAFVLALPRA